MISRAQRDFMINSSYNDQFDFITFIYTRHFIKIKSFKIEEFYCKIERMKIVAKNELMIQRFLILVFQFERAFFFFFWNYSRKLNGYLNDATIRLIKKISRSEFQYKKNFPNIG